MTQTLTRALVVVVVAAPLLASAQEERKEEEPTVYVPTTLSLGVSGGLATAAERFIAVTDVQVVDGVARVGAAPDLSPGYFVFGHLGYRPTFGISEVWWKQRLAIELAFSHASWSGSGGDRAAYLGGMVGARLDLLVKGLRPWIAEHAGYGQFTSTADGVEERNGGLAIRFSAGLDYAFNSFFRAGVNAAWQHSTDAWFGAPNGRDWYEFGASLGGGF